MTNKEAIEHINLILLRGRDNELHFILNDEKEALNIAIEALECIDDLCENLAFYINKRAELERKIKGK